MNAPDPRTRSGMLAAMMARHPAQPWMSDADPFAIAVREAITLTEWFAGARILRVPNC